MMELPTVETTDFSAKLTEKSVRRTVFCRLEHKPNFPLAQQILFFGVKVSLDLSLLFPPLSPPHPKRQHMMDLSIKINIHVLALCETWLQSSDCLYVPGFQVIRRDRPDGRMDIGFRRRLFRVK
jgi:hypothetical protein